MSFQNKFIDGLGLGFGMGISLTIAFFIFTVLDRFGILRFIFGI